MSINGDVDVPQRTRIFQFSLRCMLLVLTMTALVLAFFDRGHWPISSALVCIALVMLSVFLPPGGRKALLLIVVCAYLPYVWLLDDYPWHNYRWGWIGMWPILPGMIPGMYFFHGKHEVFEFPCMALATLVFVTIAATVVARRRWLLALTGLVVLGLSIANSFFAYAAFRA